MRADPFEEKFDDLLKNDPRNALSCTKHEITPQLIQDAFSVILVRLRG